MSTFFKVGDMVSMSSGGETVINVAYPLNDLTPLISAICDCSQDGLPISYIPYRVYAGDTCIMKQTDSGPALIPEDVCAQGKYNLTNLDTGSAYAVQQVTPYGYTCPGSSCGNYGNFKIAGVLVCRAAGESPITGAIVNRCPSKLDNGAAVGGDDSRTHSTDHVVVQSVNAYEYVEFTTNTPIIATDVLSWTSGNDPGYPLRLSAVSGQSNTYRVEAYPGRGGKFGLAASEGGYGSFYIWMSVYPGIAGLGMYGWVRNWVGAASTTYQPQSRGVTITLKNTGRYGNYR